MKSYKFITDMDLDMLSLQDAPMKILTIGGSEISNVRITGFTKDTLTTVCPHGKLHVFPWRAIACVADAHIEKEENKE